MMGFLDHLAGIALGAKPAAAARPSLPPRFASPSPVVGGSEQGFGAVEETGPPTNAGRDGRARDRRTARIDLPLPFARGLEGQALETSPTRTLPREVEARASEFRSALQGVARHLPPRPLVDAAREARPDTGVSSPVVNGPAAPLQPALPAMSRPVLPRTPLAAPPVRPVTRAAPLSDAIVAGRAMSAREEGPVIHITIDRLDVRPPASPETAAERRRPRSQPTVSLSDYLREGSRGGRE
jgi:hypothetical protein